MYAFTVGGKRISGKIYLLFTRLVIGLHIDFNFNFLSIEQSDNVTRFHEFKFEIAKPWLNFVGHIKSVPIIL